MAAINNHIFFHQRRPTDCCSILYGLLYGAEILDFDPDSQRRLSWFRRLENTWVEDELATRRAARCVFFACQVINAVAWRKFALISKAAFGKLPHLCELKKDLESNRRMMPPEARHGYRVAQSILEDFRWRSIPHFQRRRITRKLGREDYEDPFLERRIGGSCALLLHSLGSTLNLPDRHHEEEPPPKAMQVYRLARVLLKESP